MELRIAYIGLEFTSFWWIWLWGDTWWSVRLLSLSFEAYDVSGQPNILWPLINLVVLLLGGMLFKDNFRQFVLRWDATYWTLIHMSDFTNWFADRVFLFCWFHIHHLQIPILRLLWDSQFIPKIPLWTKWKVVLEVIPWIHRRILKRLRRKVFRCKMHLYQL